MGKKPIRKTSGVVGEARVVYNLAQKRLQTVMLPAYDKPPRSLFSFLARQPGASPCSKYDHRYPTTRGPGLQQQSDQAADLAASPNGSRRATVTSWRTALFAALPQSITSLAEA